MTSYTDRMDSMVAALIIADRDQLWTDEQKAEYAAGALTAIDAHVAEREPEATELKHMIRHEKSMAQVHQATGIPVRKPSEPTVQAAQDRDYAAWLRTQAKWLGERLPAYIDDMEPQLNAIADRLDGGAS